LLSHRLENWARDIIERVEAGGRIEDSRVEAKREWPNPVGAARQIAAHANAADGSPILWLIGIDEKAHLVPGADYQELANWFPAVQSQFDDLAPALQDINVPYKGVTVVALCFETDRAPFVVTNPDGGRIGHEMPWREGTKTRSARRADLLRVLSGRASLPDVEPLSVALHVSVGDVPSLLKWVLIAALYISPEGGHRIVIPYHRCRATVEFSDPRLVVPFANFSLARQERSNPITNTVYAATTFAAHISGPAEYVSSEAVIDHPSRYILYAEAATTKNSKPGGNGIASIVLRPTGAKTSVSVLATLEPIPAEKGEVASWYFVGEGLTFG
jgi:hypothetical protein